MKTNTVSHLINNYNKISIQISNNFPSIVDFLSVVLKNKLLLLQFLYLYSIMYKTCNGNKSEILKFTKEAYRNSTLILISHM